MFPEHTELLSHDWLFDRINLDPKIQIKCTGQYCHACNTAQHCRLGYFQDSDFVGDFEVSTSISEESFVFLEVQHLFPSVGCVRNKLLIQTALQILKLFLLMQVHAWMKFPHLIFGTWFLRCCILLSVQRS